VDVLREGLAPELLDEALIFGDELAEVVGGEFGVEREALVFLGDLQRFLERAVIEFEDDVGVHLDEAAIAVPGEPCVFGGLREALDGLVVEAEIEDGVHHSRHRCAGAGADRDEQRVCGIAEGLAGDGLDVREAGGDLVAQRLRELAALLVIDRAEIGRDREARRDRQADRRHLGEVRALAAEQVLVALAAIRNTAAEAVHILGHRGSSKCLFLWAGQK
jgi:hypothetical protein